MFQDVDAVAHENWQGRGDYTLSGSVDGRFFRLELGFCFYPEDLAESLTVAVEGENITGWGRLSLVCEHEQPMHKKVPVHGERRRDKARGERHALMLARIGAFEAAPKRKTGEHDAQQQAAQREHE
jgi:hypothetical protein